MRPRLDTIAYFPHDVDHGKTLFVVEQQHGNDGYCFWFKLLERLGKARGHTLDFGDDAEVLYFCAGCRVDREKFEKIMRLLAELGAIDAELWEKRIVWCQNFVDRIADVYAKRRTPLPVRPGGECEVSGPVWIVNGQEVHGWVWGKVIKAAKPEVAKAHIALYKARKATDVNGYLRKLASEKAFDRPKELEEPGVLDAFLDSARVKKAPKPTKRVNQDGMSSFGSVMAGMGIG